MNQQNRLRWGILGAARINERLLPAIMAAPNAELVGIASRRPGAARETLQKFAPCYPDIQALDDLDALIAHPEIQALYIPMANGEHAEWVLRAIAQKKHVLCEKPLALSVEDIDTIATAARANAVTVMEGFMYRFHPQHERVMEIIQSGLIGEIRSVRSNFSFMMRPARMYRLAQPVAQGGGAMWDIGCYAIHTLRKFFDHPPLAVSAMAKYIDSGADISASGILDYGDGKFAQFDFSFERARRCEYEIIGTKGGLKCHVVWQLPGDIPIISWWTEDGRQAEERLPAANHFNLEIEHFSDCVLQGKPTLLSLQDARENCQIIVAALESAATGQVVRL